MTGVPGRRILLCALLGTNIAGGVASARAPKVVRITIGAMAFSVPSSPITAGDKVEWVNSDVVDHTATEKTSGLWDVSVAPGERVTTVMKTGGTFDYYCRYHPNMVSRIVVGTAKGSR